MSDASATKLPRTPHPLIVWWTREVQNSVDHESVFERVKADAGWNEHYAFMTLMSAGIAVLGLLLSSPAVVIGAMLISPLMGPIVALGFGLATFDSEEIRRALLALGLGIALAVGFCALIVVLSPLQTVTVEIAARTRPNFFDLLVALFSGLAGAYSMIRGRHGAIVGVAIATALMPPLATIGFGLATTNGTVFWGAGLLFLTNLMVIALAAAIMARLYRFGHRLSPRQTGLQATLIVVTFLALGIPLGLALKQIAWESVASRQAREIIAAQFDPQARLSDVQIDYDARPITIAATVLSPTPIKDAERNAGRALNRALGVPIQIEIDQIRVGSGDADANQVAAARGTSLKLSSARIAERLALVAGVATDDVLIDPLHRRAQVRAVLLASATLETFKQLEERVAVSEPNWTIELIPPAIALPQVSFDGSKLSSEGQRATMVAAWAAERRGSNLVVMGGAPSQRELVVEALNSDASIARPVPGGRSLTLKWDVE